PGTAPVAARLVEEAEHETGGREQGDALYADGGEKGARGGVGEAGGGEDGVHQSPLARGEAAGGQVQDGLERAVRVGGRGREGGAHARDQRLAPLRRLQRLSHHANVAPYPMEIMYILNDGDARSGPLQPGQKARLAAPVADHHVGIEG